MDRPSFSKVSKQLEKDEDNFRQIALFMSHSVWGGSVIKYAGIPDCPASCQPGTGLKITNDAVHGPVPE
jgi:hypothetical protein